MTRSPLFLAALASSAVPGLEPVSVEGLRPRRGSAYDVAYVADSEERRWVVKAPRTQAAGAMLDDISVLPGLLARRLDVAMPVVRGHAPVPEGRAVVYLRVPGRPLDFAGLEPGDLAGDIGRALAHIHNLELLLFEEAGRPTYDAEAHRRRQLSELDRAAATGHVPTNLLIRWEARLEDISLWRFAPTPVHGTFTGDNVLASFEDEDDAAAGRVRGVLAWEESRVGDPADDFADLVARAPAAALDDVLDAYTQTRIERPDPNLLARARLAAEMAPMRVLLRSLAVGDLALVDAAADTLRALDERTYAEDEERAAAAAAITPLVVVGTDDSGDHDSGDHDSGDHDSGDHDSGDHDSGDHDSGDHDSGDHDSRDLDGPTPDPAESSAIQDLREGASEFVPVHRTHKNPPDNPPLP